MPSSETFAVRPIREFVIRFLKDGMISVDAFARDSTLCTFTNDLNPNTSAEYHLDAVEFLGQLYDAGMVADLGILDPPYSVRQVAECYKSVGKQVTQQDTRSDTYTKFRTAMDKLIVVGGVVLSFGWNSVGMGINRGYEIEEILLVCHGGVHNDTICMAERKIILKEDTR